MRIVPLLLSVFVLSGCAANLKFIDRSNGSEYSGTTGSTFGGKGSINALIEGSRYDGSFIYMDNGGGYSLTSGMVSTTTGYAYGQALTSSVSASGKGLVTMRSSQGEFIRCVFNFNSLSNKGIGECLRNDGRVYDLWIDR